MGTKALNRETPRSMRRPARFDAACRMFTNRDALHGRYRNCASPTFDAFQIEKIKENFAYYGAPIPYKDDRSTMPGGKHLDYYKIYTENPENH